MTDIQLRELVEAELEWEPSLNAAEVAVTVRKGIVTLSGHVATYAERLAAERAARRVKDVRGIALDIEVRPPTDRRVDDEDIAKRAVNSLSWSSNIPASNIQVAVKNGWLTLTGEVDWHFQREAAGKAVRYLEGVTGMSNQITLKKKDGVKPADIRQRISSALARNAAAEAQQVHIDVGGDEVRLSGKVHSWHDRKIIEDTVWAAPGVRMVKDNLSVGA
jgi:osmotically-inducible protein OsmY